MRVRVRQQVEGTELERALLRRDVAVRGGDVAQREARLLLHDGDRLAPG